MRRKSSLMNVLYLAVALATAGSAPEIYAAEKSLEGKVIQSQSAKPQEISKEGIDLVKSCEGFSDHVYSDVGNPAIGWGHNLKSGENYSVITEAQGEELLRGDLDEAESIVQKYVKVPLSQGQNDALCSFVYNFGEAKFSKSKLLRKLNSKDYKGAADQFGRWVYGKKDGKRAILPGLVQRRNKERAMFLGYK